MLDKFRTLLAKLIVEYLARPLLLVIHAWRWLTAEAEDTERAHRLHSPVDNLL